MAARRATARLSKPARAERARSRLPGALLWSLKFADNLSFRSASVATHTHTSSPLANCPTTDSHCDGLGRTDTRDARAARRLMTINSVFIYDTKSHPCLPSR
eukprot:SAG22_NODE_4652_length_1204_cov_1.038009_2_plen_101_part_01